MKVSHLLAEKLDKDVTYFERSPVDHKEWYVLTGTWAYCHGDTEEEARRNYLDSDEAVFVKLLPKGTRFTPEKARYHAICINGQQLETALKTYPKYFDDVTNKHAKPERLAAMLEKIDGLKFTKTGSKYYCKVKGDDAHRIFNDARTVMKKEVNVSPEINGLKDGVNSWIARFHDYNGGDKGSAVIDASAYQVQIENFDDVTTVTIVPESMIQKR